jgi:2-polyprenyl-3-methyl-5-hydroxy-6-metoxy-1,4-benzoquinol methylase
MTTITPSHADVVRANIALHSAAAGTYDDEPHFRPESKLRVAGLLDKLLAGRSGSMLDLGCGTGFLSSIADQFVDSIVGIDATRAMVEIARRRTYRCDAEFRVDDVMAVELAAGSFDVVAGYAFLHHLLDPMALVARAANWVKPGGIVYFDLEPNKIFWSALEDVSATASRSTLGAPVLRELRSVGGSDEAAHYGVDEATFALAEYTKKIAGGIDLAEVATAVSAMGLVDFQPIHHWFVGEAGLIGRTVEGSDVEVRSLVDDLLQSALPLSSPMYKYVGFTARRAD